MNEIDQVSNSFLYASVQNSSNPLAKTDKKDAASKVKKGAFSKLLKEEPAQEEFSFSKAGLPPEVQNLSFDETVVYLKDAVDLAGNDLAEDPSFENINKFKKTVKDFITFVVANNYNVQIKQQRGFKNVRVNQVFSKYSDIPSPKDPKVAVSILNQKLDSLVYDTLMTQRKNLNTLARINEIKGLIVDILGG
ncbi:MAG: YaaR family protein [Treponema sp.]|nr:YaaR family protein [Treponema sp.]